MTTVLDLKNVAEKRLAEGDYLRAMKVFRLVLEAAPLDFDTRLRIADCLFSLGERKLAAAVYLKVAIFDIKAGLPHRAIVAIRMLGIAAPEVGGLAHDLAVLYSKDSPLIGRGARAAPVDLSGVCREGLDLDYPMDEAALKTTTAQMAAYTDDIMEYPARVPPIPLFSRLGVEAFERLLGSLELKRCKEGEIVVREGSRGDSFFMVGRGTVRVFRHAASGARVDLARLGEGSVLGEMALVSSDPRTASVDVEGSADLIVFNRAALAAVGQEIGEVASVLEQFAQERMVMNVLSTNPLFQPFERNQRMALLERFEAHKVKAGALVVRQDEEGRGLYIVLSGAVEVTKKAADGKPIPLATLGPGETFGEISLVHDRPTTASVQAARDTTILFLPREYFQKILEAMPGLAQYFLDLGVQRLLDTKRAEQQAAAQAEVMPVSDDELIFV